MSPKKLANVATLDWTFLIACYEHLQPFRQLEFWQLRCSSQDKITFLVQYGSLQVIQKNGWSQ